MSLTLSIRWVLRSLILGIPSLSYPAKTNHSCRPINSLLILCSWIVVLFFFSCLICCCFSPPCLTSTQFSCLVFRKSADVFIYHNSTTTNHLVACVTVATTGFLFLLCYKSAVRTVIHSCREKGPAGKIIRPVITDTKIGPNFTVAGEKIIEQVSIIIRVKRIVNSCWTGGF